MTNPYGHEASQAEMNLLEAVLNKDMSNSEFLSLLRSLPTPERFVMAEEWMELVRSESIENWRRLEAYKLFVYRIAIYPSSFDEFKKKAIEPLGITDGQLVDMSRAQYVPLDRKEDEKILMANLPIMTTIGPAAIYFAVHRTTQTVEHAVVYPDVMSAD